MSILFLENLQILSVLSHTYIRKPNESNEQLLLCLWQSDHHLDQVADRDNLHITILQVRLALGFGLSQTVALHVAGFVSSGEPLFQFFR